jgi:hypothetical protein
MSGNWIHYDKDWINLDDFCHIWIETRYHYLDHKSMPTETYYAKGEWRHNGEEVIITQEWDCLYELTNYIHRKIGVINEH